MRWYVFAIAAYLALALQTALRTSLGPMCPDLPLILLVFVGLGASAGSASWAALAMGLALDLTQPVMIAGRMEDLVLIGPHALGCLACVWLVLGLRGLTFEHSALSMGLLTALGGLLMHGLIVGLLSLRAVGWLAGEPLAGWSLIQQGRMRGLNLLISTLTAIPLGMLLIHARALWGFPEPQRRRFEG
jgi:hypothetical protein